MAGANSTCGPRTGGRDPNRLPSMITDDLPRIPLRSVRDHGADAPEGSPGAGERAAVPGLDDAVRDRHWWWQQQFTRHDLGRELVAGEPACLYDLLVVHCDLLPVSGFRTESQHQALRHRPGLAADIPDAADGDPRLLSDLARHGLLRGLPRLDETGQDGDPARGPEAVACEQAAILVVGHEHDHGRVDPGEVFAAVDRAASRVPRGGWHGQGAAARAVGVPGV